MKKSINNFTLNKKRLPLEMMIAVSLIANPINYASASSNAAIASQALMSNITTTILQGTNGPAGAANGIDFNLFNRADTQLYGASLVDGKVYILNSNTGATIDVFGPELGIVSPDDIVVSPTGEIYYTDTLIGQIKKINLTTRQITVVASNLPFINSIRFSTDGNHLYAGQCFNFGGQNGLWEIDLSGNGNNRLISDTLDTSCSINSFEFKDGYIYGPRFFVGDVIRLDPQSGSYNVVSAGFTNPSAVNFSESGPLYVVDYTGNHLKRIDHPILNNQTAVLVTTLPGQNSIDNLAIKKKNHGGDYIYVSGGNNGYVAKIDSTTGKIDKYIKTDGVVLPMGMALANNDTLLLSDYNSLRIVDVKRKKIIKSTATDPVFTGAGIVRPLNVAKFGNNALVCDWFAQKIQLWDYQNDAPLALITPANTPLSAIEYQNMIVSAEYNPTTNTATLVQYSGADYQTVTTLVTLSSAVFAGLATDGQHIWISDTNNGKIYRYDSGSLTTVADSLSGPKGIALDKDGAHLLVIEVGAKRLSSIQLNNGSKTVVETNLPVGYSDGIVPSFYFVTGIAVDNQSGNIYYSGDATRVVNRIKR